ncbi:MAG: diguanylate cyclase [Campylobacterota bacterium]
MKTKSYQDLKVRLLIFIALVLVILVAIVNFLEYKKTKSELEQKIELKSAFVTQVYENIITSYKHSLMQVIYDIKSNDAILEAFQNRDRAALQAQSYPQFTQLQKDFGGFSIMHFHLPKGDSFLRLHALDNYGDNLWDIRAMIQKVHTSQKPAYGFEMGKYDQSFLTYRVAVPLFDSQQRYLGAFEVGVNSQAILDTIRNIFQNIDAQAAFFVQKDKLRHSLTLQDIQKQQSKYILASHNEGFKTDIFTPEDVADKRIEDAGDILQLRVYENFIKNYLGASIGIFVLQYDISADMGLFKSYLTAILIVSFIVIVIVLYIVNYGFNYYLQHIKHEHRLFVKEHQKAQLILDSQSNLVVLVDNDEPILANKAFLEFFQVAGVKEFRQKYSSIARLFKKQKGYFYIEENSSDSWMKRLKDMPLQDRKVMIGTSEGELIFEIEISEYEGKKDLYVLTFDDITLIMNKQDELSQRVYQDSLTAIYNRRYFEKVIDDIFAHVKKGQPYSLILFDIDNFKNVNDTYGHNFGDRVLQSIAKEVMHSLRSEDLFIRWGGEEFLIVLKGTALSSSIKVAQKLRKLIKYNKIGDIYVTCSFGVTQVQHGDTSELMIERVDRAMYSAKKSGKDRVEAM